MAPNNVFAARRGLLQVALWSLLTLTLLFGGCAFSRQERATLHAPEGFQRVDVDGEPFRHAVLLRIGPAAGDVFRAYVEGDGLPWSRVDRPAADPTPRDAVGLRLMQADPQALAFIGRPCYWGMATSPPCEPIWWTHGRFSNVVVRSMIVALRATVRMADVGVRCVELIGYSGGGTLAVLMARQMDEVCAVTTVASPLDIDAWAGRLEYSPLDRSDNPAALPPLPARVAQVHLRGSLDAVVDAANGRDWVRRHRDATLRVISGYDHVCCWVRDWPTILKSIDDPGS